MYNPKYLLCFLIAFLGVYTEGSSQASINTDGSAPDPNAILDLKSTNKAFLPPRMTFEQIKAIPSPKEGMMAYDTEFKCLRIYTGMEWQCQQAADKSLTDPTGDFSIFSTSTFAVSNSSAIDASGNVYNICRFTTPTITFGTTTVTNTSSGGTNDVAVVKYNSSGEVVWAINVGGAGHDIAGGIAVDAVGNVYITGSFSSTSITIGSATFTNALGYYEVFVAKFNSAGSPLWAIRGTGGLDDFGTGIAVDGSGNPFISGYFQSNTITFGSTVLTNTNTNGSNDALVLKFNTATGAVLWGFKNGGTGFDFGNDIAVDASGNAYLVGSFASSTAQFGPTAASSTITLTNVSFSYDVFILKYDPNGVLLWANRGGGVGEDQGNSVAVDGSSNVYITGHFTAANATFGATVTNSNTATSNFEVFVAKYNTSGVSQWAVSGGGATGDSAEDIAVDALGNAYVTGSFMSTTAAFGSTNLTNTGSGGASQDVFVVKYNPSGVVSWAVKGGGTAADIGESVVVNTAGTRVYTSVYFFPNAKFGNAILKTGYFLLWMYGE
jgi:hypothetical protein